VVYGNIVSADAAGLFREHIGGNTARRLAEFLRYMSRRRLSMRVSCSYERIEPQATQEIQSSHA
jgi:hypothetical protein